MSIWSRLWKKAEAPTEATPPAAEAEAPAKPEVETDLTRLGRIGQPGGPRDEEAIATFRRLRSSPDEGAAIEVLTQVDTTHPLADALAVLVASALVDRGEAARALAMLRHASAPESLSLAADLHARNGDLPRALTFIERILARAIDFPGARERHRRWRTELGLDVAPRRADANAATVATRDAEAPFRLLREVARGGAGAVYEAEDRELGRRVALKVYHAIDRDRAQLLHEARVAAELGALVGAARGIVRVFDVDADHGWIALEWAALGALRDHIRGRDVATLVPIDRWALPLTRALARVHAAGWVHNDVKPANVLLLAEDRPALADFGIARRIGEPSPAGSLGYVSPERIAGRASDPRDDVYAFGRLLEDTLAVLKDRVLEARFRPILAACVGPDETRPKDARSLLDTWPAHPSSAPGHPTQY